jgi:23S rRNA pseudouridine1911/1915/1917 synthase
MGRIVIGELMADNRLDKFLAEKYDNRSRSDWQKIISAGLVTINNRPVKAHAKLMVGDVINWPAAAKCRLVASRPVSQVTKPVGRSPRLKIIIEQPDYLVVNKPAGLLVHDNVWPPTRPTVAEAVVKKYSEIGLVGENKTRPGIVHRLDKDVSGLMVIARNAEMFASLKRQFQYRTIKKYYTALVYGTMSKPDGVINFNLTRSSDGRKMAARPINQDGKKAITEYEVIKQWQNYSLLKVIIKTGRTHQIRAHLAALDHPLVGDDWYGTNKTKLKNKELGLGRVFLVASQLSFLDKDKVRQNFKIRLPRQLTDLLQQIK